MLYIFTQHLHNPVSPLILIYELGRKVREKSIHELLIAVWPSRTF